MVSTRLSAAEQFEGYVGSNQALGKEEAHFGKMTQAALEFARGSFATCSEEHNWYEHF